MNSGVNLNGDAALGQQFLNIPVGQAVPQVPADRERDHLGREPEATKDRGRARWSRRISLPPYAIDQRNSAAQFPCYLGGGGSGCHTCDMPAASLMSCSRSYPSV